MMKEQIILALIWVLTAIILIVFIPKKRIREALTIFMFKQLLTWPIGLMVAQYKLIEYPVRLFPYANKASFDFEYFFYPATCSIFAQYYPHGKSKVIQFLYYSAFCTVITISEVILEKYTNLVKYINWHWYISWISLFATFYISFHFYLWFFRINKKQSNQID